MIRNQNRFICGNLKKVGLKTDVCQIVKPKVQIKQGDYLEKGRVRLKNWREIGRAGITVAPVPVSKQTGLILFDAITWLIEG